MKTKCGKCDNCPLVAASKYYQHSVTSNNNSVNEADILVVCDYNEHGQELVDFFKNEHGVNI